MRAAIEPVTPTLLASVQEVNLVLSVTDHRGKFMSGLLPTDLTILDNDQRQSAVTFFQSETDLPLDVVLLIDASSSVTYGLAAEQKTIKNFVKHVARPSDKVAVFAFNDRVRFISEVSNNWNAIAHSVTHLKPGGYTALFDAVTSAAFWLRQDNRPARRIIILLTDGEENHSKATLSQAIAQALKSEASLYAVNVSHGYWDSDSKAGEVILKQLADSTGGRYFKDQEGSATDAFGKIQRELRSQYALAYKPTNLGVSLFHRIQVLAPGKLRVRCRSGYYVDAKR